MTKLRELRKAAGMSLAELSFKTGIDEAFLSKLERGYKRANKSIRSRIAGVLGQRETEIFHHKGVPVAGHPSSGEKSSAMNGVS